MSAHQMNGPGDDAGRVALTCNADGCDATFTVRSFATAKTRISAEARGWSVGTRADRRDFCPLHAHSLFELDTKEHG